MISSLTLNEKDREAVRDLYGILDYDQFLTRAAVLLLQKQWTREHLVHYAAELGCTYHHQGKLCLD